MAFSFNNVGIIGNYTNGEQIENSLISWLGWCFLNTGAFYNIDSTSVDSAGNPLNVLTCVDDARYGTLGTVWQSKRSQWIWETGIAFPVQPTPVNSVAVNGSAVNTANYYVNYPEGRIIFASPVSPTAVVTANFSYRYNQIHKSSVSWFQDLQYRSFRNDEPDIDTWSGNRVQMPAVVAQRIHKASSRPYEIGNTSGIYQHDFLLHCLGEGDRDAGRQHDILVNQFDNRIPAYDSNLITFPLNSLGTPIAGALNYPGLVAAAPWRQIRVAAATSNPGPWISQHLVWCIVRMTLEVDSA